MSVFVFAVIVCAPHHSSRRTGVLVSHKDFYHAADLFECVENRRALNRKIKFSNKFYDSGATYICKIIRIQVFYRQT